MNITGFLQLFARVFFVVALGMLGIAAAELLLNLFNYTILRGQYSPGRLIELSAALMVFVIALLLRQIRDNQAP